MIEISYFDNDQTISQSVDAFLSLADTSDIEIDLESTLNEIPAGERAARLYTYLNEYKRHVSKEKADNRYRKLRGALDGSDKKNQVKPFNRRLLARMKALWQNKETKDIFLEKYKEATLDFIASQKSPIGKQVLIAEQSHRKLTEEHKELTKTLFIDSSLSESDRIEALLELEEVVSKLKKQRAELQSASTLDDFHRNQENCDVLALHQADKFREMRHQLDKDSFIWFESIIEIYQEALLSLTNGRWPLLIGEAGTGKSVLAVEIAKTLTGNPALLVACTPQTNERHLIAQLAMNANGTYEQYGAAMRALSGFNSSADEKMESETGRIVRLDELFKLGKDSPLFAFLKELAGLKPGDIYRAKEVLKGYKIIATTNPTGTRYGNPPPNPALIREFATIHVDYPKMTKDSPELFEMMIASLMNKESIIVGISKEEISPYFEEINANQQLSADKRIIKKWELVEDATDQRHGYLYRLAYAIRAVQDAFTFGSNQEKPEKILRKQTDGTVTGGDEGEPILLNNSTITPGDINDWLENFGERRKHLHQIGQTKSLSEYLQEQLKLYVKQADPNDRANLLLIFNHFKLLSDLPEIKPILPITLKEIGYLSPTVPRPFLFESNEKQINKSNETILYETVEVTLRDGGSINLKPIPLELEELKSSVGVIQPREIITLNDFDYEYAGLSEDGKQMILKELETDLYTAIDLSELTQKRGESPNHFNFPEKEAIRHFGEENYFGTREIVKIEEQFRRLGMNLRFKFDSYGITRSHLKLSNAIKDIDPKNFSFILTPSSLSFSDDLGNYDGEITLEVLSSIFCVWNGANNNDYPAKLGLGGEIAWWNMEKQDFIEEKLSKIAQIIQNQSIRLGSKSILEIKKEIEYKVNIPENLYVRNVTDVVWEMIMRMAKTKHFPSSELEQITTTIYKSSGLLVVRTVNQDIDIQPHYYQHTPGRSGAGVRGTRNIGYKLAYQ